MNFFFRSNLSSYVSAVMVLFMLFAFSCKDDEEVKPVPETSTMTDIEGNVYKTVKIGNQWWMSENLKVKRYRDSSLIQQITSDAQWTQDSAGGYSPYGSDYTNTGNPPVYGFLYNWHAIHNSHHIAPAGWHIPTDAEWKELEKHLGMSASDADLSGWRGSTEGEKLKIEAPQGWTQYGDVWGTNESGFAALAGSCRLFDGRSGDPGLFCTGFWWTATEHNSTDAWYRYLDYKNTNVFRSSTSKNYGFSIRCVKD